MVCIKFIVKQIIVTIAVKDIAKMIFAIAVVLRPFFVVRIISSERDEYSDENTPDNMIINPKITTIDKSKMFLISTLQLVK